MLNMNIVVGISDLDPKFIDSGKFGPNTEICFDVYVIRHSKIEHANYEYSTRQCLERSLNYWLRTLKSL